MIKKIVRVAAAFVLLNISFLITLVLFPGITYAHETSIEGVTLFHNKPLPDHFVATVKESLEVVKQASIYRGMPEIEICLNDGAVYPAMVRSLMGDDVFRAFANKSVMMGTVTGPDRMRIWGREVSTGQFLTHAMIHNLQYDYHGFWDSNPLGRHAEWKWEGYVEYELLGDMHTLSELNEKWEGAEDNFDWVDLGQGKGTVKRHIAYLMLVKYLFEQKGMSYLALIDDLESEEEVWKELMEFISLTNR